MHFEEQSLTKQVSVLFKIKPRTLPGKCWLARISESSLVRRPRPPATRPDGFPRHSPFPSGGDLLQESRRPNPSFSLLPGPVLHFPAFLLSFPPLLGIIYFCSDSLGTRAEVTTSASHSRPHGHRAILPTPSRTPWPPCFRPPALLTNIYLCFLRKPCLLCLYGSLGFILFLSIDRFALCSPLFGESSLPCLPVASASLFIRGHLHSISRAVPKRWSHHTSGRTPLPSANAPRSKPSCGNCFFPCHWKQPHGDLTVPCPWAFSRLIFANSSGAGNCT